MSVCLNTNLASLKIQKTLTDSTDKLALAIERMTTGFRINCAADDAAGYSIANRMDTNLSAYAVASENAQMGSSMLSTAEGGLNIITNHLERIRDLAIQASNETYGTDARNAMQAEANSRLEETQRILSTTEYNDKNIFAGEAGVIRTGKFIDDAVTYSAAEVAEMTALGSVSTSTTISTGKYSISTDDELAQLATMVNNGKVTGGEFVLAADIDLGHIDNWTPIGNSSAYSFKGIFNGNGHVVKNMKIKNTTSYYAGLFGATENATIKNVGVVDCDVKDTSSYSSSTGSLIGYARNGIVHNCFSTGKVYSSDTSGGTGGLIGGLDSGNIECSYTSVTTQGINKVGGLVGMSGSSQIIQCYTEGKTSASGLIVGGLIGELSSSSLGGCFATGETSGRYSVGGLVGSAESNSTSNTYIDQCYSTGKVSSIEGIAITTDSTFSTDPTQYTLVNSTAGTDNTFGGLIGSCFRDSRPSSSLYLYKCSYNDAINPSLAGVVGSFSESTWYTGSTGSTAQTALTNSTNPESVLSVDLTPKLAPSESGGGVTLQVGIGSDEHSKLDLDMTFSLGAISLDFSTAQGARAAVQEIDTLLSSVSQKKTVFGAAQNRLSSVLDALNVSIQNTTSALSTIRDADIATVSSSYIKNQILQQAASALLTSANQSPSIALQLI